MFQIVISPNVILATVSSSTKKGDESKIYAFQYLLTHKHFVFLAISGKAQRK